MFRYDITDRLSLVVLAPYHARTLLELHNTHHPSLKRYDPTLATLQTLPRMRYVLRHDFALLSVGHGWTWLITEDERTLGRAQLRLSGPALHIGQIMLWLAREDVASAVQVVAAIIDFAIAELGVQRIVLQMQAGSLLMPIAQAAGFEEEALLRHHLAVDDGYADERVYSMLASNWHRASHPAFAHRVAHRLDETLELRLQTVQYIGEFYGLILDNAHRLRPWFEWLDDGYTLEKEELYTWQRLQAYGLDGGMSLGIWYQGRLVGSLSLNIEAKSGEIGYWLDAAYDGRGIVTRTVRALIDHSFAVLKLQRVWLRAAVDNQPSRRVAERVGMQQEAILRHDEFINGRWVDHVVYSVLAEAWLVNKIRGTTPSTTP